MAFTTASDGIRLHYETFGSRRGEPVLMIQGLGADITGWNLQRPALALGGYRTIALDNRGAGRSDKPSGTYSLEQMAADAITVLDAVGCESAHVLGASMGGVIAQIIAVRYPERVRSLTLACTAARNHPWRRDLVAEWAKVAETQGMGALAGTAARWVMSPRSMRRASPFFGWLGPLAFLRQPHAFVSQVNAILDVDEDLSNELRALRVPAMVVVGNQDILTPRGDSETLAELIPGAELVVISGAAHGLMVEHWGTFNRVLLDFLGRARRSNRTADSPATQRTSNTAA